MSFLVGIDLGGTNTKAAVATDGGEVIGQTTTATDAHLGPEHVIGQMAELVTRLLHDHKINADGLQAVGVGVPGLVDISLGESRFLPNLPTQWRNVPVAKLLAEKLSCPVRLMNDARTATLGEMTFGHGRDCSDISMAFFSLGTGVGGGLVIDGKLRLGPLGAAGELGHQTILSEGPQCGCGSRGCLETLASGPAIAAEGVRLMQSGLAPHLRDQVGGKADLITTKEMSLAAQHDPAVAEAITRAATYIGLAAANVVSVVHPDLIVLGGGVSQIGDLLTKTVKQVITNRVGMFPTDNVEVVTSMLEDQAGVMGAIALAREV